MEKQVNNLPNHWGHYTPQSQATRGSLNPYPYLRRYKTQVRLIIYHFLDNTWIKCSIFNLVEPKTLKSPSSKTKSPFLYT